MRSRPQSYYQCFGCLHVRTLSLALFTSHVVANLMVMCILTHLLAVTFHHRSAQLTALGPTHTERSFIREVVRVEMAEDNNDTADTEEVLLAKSTLNVNVTKFISVFLVVPAEPLTLNHTQLLYSLLYSSVSGLTALTAIIGVLRGAPSLIIPFLVGHILDIIFSTIYISGWDVYGYVDSAALRKLRGLIQDDGSDTEHWYQNIHIWALMAAVLIILVKLYFIRIFCLTMLFIREEKARLLRDARQQKWLTGILQGHVVVDTEPDTAITPPPPTYDAQAEEERHEEPPAYSV
ncbi:uncharacterized protein LOC129588770 [Paramacrobiotus metropolitanus]|uniref:uncharacterized protein LOC129588770 n=1 Tax=Paramacrobiotus metropolitanus TaxID=2943436 RepID=UPI0024461BD0|nr:uncharacterized protein LOC129588770 [Paramacrobiotus metropolitanus]